nr:glycosyl hydrolase family 8 [Falsiroseomonas algicola]
MQHPAADVPIQAVGLRHSSEAAGADQSVLRVLPPNQRLDVAPPAVFHPHLRRPEADWRLFRDRFVTEAGHVLDGDGKRPEGLAWALFLAAWHGDPTTFDLMLRSARRKDAAALLPWAQQAGSDVPLRADDASARSSRPMKGAALRGHATQGRRCLAARWPVRPGNSLKHLGGRHRCPDPWPARARRHHIKAPHPGRVNDILRHFTRATLRCREQRDHRPRPEMRRPCKRRPFTLSGPAALFPQTYIEARTGRAAGET